MISLVCLDVNFNPKIPGAKSKAVSEGNGPVLQYEYESGELMMMVEMYRVLK